LPLEPKARLLMMLSSNEILAAHPLSLPSATTFEPVSKIASRDGRGGLRQVIDAGYAHTLTTWPLSTSAGAVSVITSPGCKKLFM
jgi:hypothetical protein